MKQKRNHKRQAATSFLEYTIILGVASAVLIGMNTYVKRGIQGRLKEMTDFFISNDSGLAHIAAAVGTEVIVLFGKTDLWRIAPRGPGTPSPNEMTFTLSATSRRASR